MFCKTANTTAGLRALGAGIILLPFLVGAAGARYEVRLEQERLDYMLPPPEQRNLALVLRAKDAPEKARIMFTAPVAAGGHRLDIEVVNGRRDRTVVIATPVAVGRSTFRVSIAGQGRFDLGFWSGGPVPREYRFTLLAPVREKVIVLDMPR